VVLGKLKHNVADEGGVAGCCKRLLASSYARETAARSHLQEREASELEAGPPASLLECRPRIGR
jgi:hypothetical protein